MIDSCRLTLGVLVSLNYWLEIGHLPLLHLYHLEQAQSITTSRAVIAHKCVSSTSDAISDI